ASDLGWSGLACPVAYVAAVCAGLSFCLARNQLSNQIHQDLQTLAAAGFAGDRFMRVQRLRRRQYQQSIASPDEVLFGRCDSGIGHAHENVASRGHCYVMKCNYTAAADESGSRVVRERSMHKRMRQHAPLSSGSVTFDASGKATATLTITAWSGGTALMVRDPHHHDSHPFSGGWLPVAAFAVMGTGLSCGYSRRRRYLFFVGCVSTGLIFH